MVAHLSQREAASISPANPGEDRMDPKQCLQTVVLGTSFQTLRFPLQYAI